VLEFKKKRNNLGHFPNQYESMGDLKHHFGEQLKKMDSRIIVGNGTVEYQNILDLTT
jgi:hypothetical protein